jgi:tetratricopeptide (TPR) repeat protein
MKILKNLIIFLSILVSSSLFAQNQEIEKLVREGIELHDKGEFEKAIKIYQKALELNPNSSLVNYEIALSYMANKNYKNAEIYSKKVIDFNGDHILGAYVNYGTALDMLGQPNKAIEAYELAMKDFDHYLLYYNHAITCFNAELLDKAYDSAIKAITNNSAHASSHLILSKVMERKGSRIKAILPLYFFLLIEPNSNRAAIEYQTLRGYIDQGVTQKSEKNIDVIVPTNQDPDFGAAEMMLSLSKASNSLEKNKGKADLELFADNNEHLFRILGELKKDNKGFWWDFYVPFFYDLAKENLTVAYTYYISLSKGEDVTKWIEENDVEFKRFTNWIGG